MTSRFDSLKDDFIKNKILVENFTFLSALQVTNLFLFLITIPYLFRVLGSRSYGLVVFSQSIAFYFSILVNFGFNLTATKDISVSRDEKAKISEIVSSVLTLKVIFFIISLILMSLFTVLIPLFRMNRLLFMFSMIACLSDALFPVWYFQGIEKMKYITYINVTTRIIATILVFVLIDSPSKYVIYPLLLGIGTVTGALFALMVVFRIHRINFRFQSISVLKKYFRENLLYFLSNVSTQIYVNANKIIIGSFLGMVEVAYYDLAEKVINIVKVPYSILGQSLFPRFAKEKDIIFLKRMMIFTITCTIILIIVVYLFSGLLITFLSGFSNAGSIKILRILSLSLLPVSISLFYGDLLLINSGLRRQYARMRFSGLVFYLACFFLLYFSHNIGIIEIAIVVVAVESYMSLYSFILCRQNSIF
jgi:O-antigen/teichoic acid export membrane protein